MTGLKALPIKFIGRWKLLAFNYRLASLYIPGLIAVLSLLSLLFLAPNPSLQVISFSSSTTQLHNYHLIEGALLSFAVFTALLAFYKKNRFFLISAAWILCNLRLGSYMLGMDAFWMQLQIPIHLTSYINQITVGMYFILSQQLLQFSLNISPSSNQKNSILGLIALGVFVLSLIPAPDLFHAVTAVIIPLALLIALTLSVQRVLIERVNLYGWQIILLSILVSALASSLLSLLSIGNTVLSHFNALIFLILCNSMIVFGIASRISQLQQSQNELRSNYQNSPFSVLKINHEGQILRSNRAFRRLCAKLSQPRPLVWNMLFPDQNWKHIVKRTQAGKYTEIQLNSTDSTLDVQKPLFALHANTIPEGYVLTLQDITPYMNTLNRLKAMADNDPVTQVLNQRGLEKALQYAIHNLGHHQPCFIAYLDVNHVNHVNRTYGHASGDALLQEVSLRINDVLKQRHSFGRIGSDDFVFLLNNTTAEKAQELAIEITSKLNKTVISTPFRDYELNVHLGLVEIGEGMDEQAALRTAQSACVDALRRNTDFVLYEHNSKEMQYRAEELQLFEHLENGTTRGLFVEMQPLMDLQNPLASLNVEVLLRIRRDNGELIPLHTFIPDAEENGTISIIDKWVFMATLEWLNSNRQHLASTKQINVNLSGYSLNNDKFVTDLFAILDSYKHLLNKLCVEITEGVALQDLTRTRDFMLRLQQKGVRIALDDFGAGYTSFSYLRELPANSIKIDGALIQDMLSKESNIAIVRTIVELARNLGMTCVAEWVEDVDTLAKLKEMGVHYAQGFAVSKPRSPEDIVKADDIRALIKDPAIINYIQEITHK